MANVTVTPVFAPRDEATNFDWTDLTAGDVGVIDWDGCKDESTDILFLGGAADAVATFKAGEGIQGMNDHDMLIEDGEYYSVPINSGKFKNDYGTNVGKVRVAVDKAVKIAVVCQTK